MISDDVTQNGTSGDDSHPSLLYATGNRVVTGGEAERMTGLTRRELNALQYMGGLRLNEAAVGDLIARCYDAMTRYLEGTQ